MEHTVRPAGCFLVILHSGLGTPEGGGWVVSLGLGPPTRRAVPEKGGATLNARLITEPHLHAQSGHERLQLGLVAPCHPLWHPLPLQTPGWGRKQRAGSSWQ